MQQLSNREHFSVLAKNARAGSSDVPFEPLDLPNLSDHYVLLLDEIDELLERYERGESVRQLASAYGIHRHTVSAHLERQGIQRRGPNRKLTDEQCAKIADLYSAGRSLAQIGEQFGAHAKTISNELRKLGVKIRPQGNNYG